MIGHDDNFSNCNYDNPDCHTPGVYPMKSKYKKKIKKRGLLAAILSLPENTPMPIIKKNIKDGYIVIGGKRVKVETNG